MSTDALSSWERIKMLPVTVGLLLTILGPLLGFHLLVAGYIAVRVDKLGEGVSDVRVAVARLDERAKTVDARLQAVELRLEKVESRLGGIDGQLEKVHRRVEAIEQTQAQILLLVQKQSETLNAIAVHLEKGRSR